MGGLWLPFEGGRGGSRGFGERQLLDHARTMIVAELSLARRCKRETVEKDIDAIFA